MIREDVISQVELNISAFKPSDDLEVGEEAIGFIVDKYRDAVLQDRLNKDLAEGKKIDPFYTQFLPGLEVVEETYPHNVSDVRRIVKLTVPVLSLSNDSGIVRVLTDSNQEVRKSHPMDVWVFDKLAFSSPSDGVLYYHREGENLILTGIEELYESIDYVMALVVPAMSENTHANKDNYLLDGALVDMVVDMATDEIRQSLGRRIEDYNNDGVQ